MYEERRPGPDPAWLGRAQAYEMAGRAEAALADYTAALALDGSDALTWSNRAVLHYETGRLEQAVADLDEAIVRAPGLPDLYANRAIALTDLGHPAEAARDREQYERLQQQERRKDVQRIAAAPV